MRHLLGDEYGEFVQALQGERYYALRMNPLKQRGSVSGIQKEREAGRVPWAEWGYYYDSGAQPGKYPYHEAGVYYIQEPSAMAPAELLEAQPGERVLDLCAAPGGKSTQIAGKMQGKGILLCNEIQPARAKALSENIERLGICNACVTIEPPQRLKEAFPEYFDRILVDAPCSGEGMFRKNAAACGEWDSQSDVLCAQRQNEILDDAAEMLRPGGRLVYSTCTFAPLENEGSISRFLQRHREFQLLPIDKKKFGGGCDGVPEWGDGSPELKYTLRLWPHKVHGEGHFAAVLQKAGDRGSLMPPGGTVTGISERELGDFQAFCRENLHLRGGDFAEEVCRAVGLRDKPVFLRFGANLYLAPGDMPAVKGIRVLRQGLHLGELKKNRFEPSHALALALSPDRAVHTLCLDAEDPLVYDYLNGMTFSAGGEKGWYLICVDGYSLGWGKLAGGIMKNHYPRGLRIV